MPATNENALPGHRSRSRSPGGPRKRVKDSERQRRYNSSGRHRGRTYSRSRESSRSRSRSRSQLLSPSPSRKTTRYSKKTSRSGKTREPSRSRSQSQSTTDRESRRQEKPVRPKRKATEVDAKRAELDAKICLTGKAIGRAIAFNCDFNLLVECLAAEVDNEGLPEDANAAFLAVVEMSKIYQPHIITLFRKAGKKYLMTANQILGMLRNGREQAQNVDIASIKEGLSGIFEEITFLPPLDPRNGKMLMGFNHPQCAELLRPFNADWQDDKVRANYLDSTFSPTAEDFPSFVLASSPEDADGEDPPDVLDLMFLAPCLLRAARIILFGPSHVQKTPKHASAKCNSTKNGIKKITTAFIAYIVVLLRFCLSDEVIYGNSQFAYIELYEGIVKHLDDPEFSDERKVILKTWDRELFCQIVTKAPTRTNDILSGVQGGSNFLKNLKLQRLAAKTLAAAQQPPPSVQDNDSDASQSRADAAEALADLGRNRLAPLN